MDDRAEIYGSQGMTYADLLHGSARFLTEDLEEELFGHDVRVLCGAPRQAVPQAPHVLRRFRLTDVWSRGTRGWQVVARHSSVLG